MFDEQMLIEQFLLNDLPCKTLSSLSLINKRFHAIFIDKYNNLRFFRDMFDVNNDENYEIVESEYYALIKSDLKWIIKENDLIFIFDDFTICLDDLRVSDNKLITKNKYFDHPFPNHTIINYVMNVYNDNMDRINILYKIQQELLNGNSMDRNKFYALRYNTEHLYHSMKHLDEIYFIKIFIAYVDDGIIGKHIGTLLQELKIYSQSLIQ